MSASQWSDLHASALATFIGLCPTLSRYGADPRSEALLALLALSKRGSAAERVRTV